MVCQQLQCPSGCYRRFVILLAVPLPSFGQLLCPSRHFIHYFLRYASLHHIRSYPFASWPGIPLARRKSLHMGCTSHSQANATILTGFHSASLRHSFTSVTFSPPAAYNLARRPPTSAAFTLRMLIAHSYLISQSTAKVRLHSSSCAVCFAKFTARDSYGAGIAAATWLSFFSLTRKVAAALLPAPSWGSQALPFVPLSSALWRLATSATVRTSVPHGYASFLLKAVLPAGKHTFAIPSRKTLLN